MFDHFVKLALKGLKHICLCNIKLFKRKRLNCGFLLNRFTSSQNFLLQKELVIGVSRPSNPDKNNLFAASGHRNYAKYSRLYLQEMLSLPDTNPWPNKQFEDGYMLYNVETDSGQHFGLTLL